MLRALLAAGLLLLAAADARAQTQVHLDPEKALTQYQIDHWGPDAGLPQNTITAIARTADGYLWFGTQEGLVRFDGLRFFTTYTEAEGLASDRITALTVAPDGALWVGTEGAGLSRYAGGRFTSYGVDDGLPDLLVASLGVTASGTVWVGVRGGVAFSQPDAGPDATFSKLPSFSGYVVTALAVTDRAVWIGTQSEGVFRVQDGSIVGRYGTEQGLGSPKILSLHRDPQESVWIGTDGGGIARLRGDRLDPLTAEHGLAHGTARRLFADGAGSLWIGTGGGGLNRLRDGKFDVYTTLEGLSFNHIAVVMEDRHGAVWVGTNGGGLSRLADGVVTTFTTARGFPHDQVWGLAETRDGSVWIGTGGAGLVRYHDGRFSRHTAAHGLPDETIYGLYTDRDDALWASTGKGLIRYRDGRYDLFTEAEGLASNLIAVVEQDAGGDLWIGTYDNGLNRLRDGRIVEHLSTEDGLASNTVVALYADAEGPLWIGTSDGGLSRLEDGTLTTVTTEHGLPNDKVFRILEDGTRHLWMTSNKGVFKVSKDSLDAFARGTRTSIDATLYDEHDGLRSAEFFGGTQPAGWKGRDGRLWLPSVHGLVSIDPQRIPLDLVPPRLVIESVIAGETRLAHRGETLTIAPGAKKFEIHYAALSFLAPEDVAYEYRLDGVDDAWVQAGGRREAYYTNLAPGAYTFSVRARNGDGVWSTEPATAAIYLRPFFWQTTWFRVLLVVAGALALVGGYRLRVARLKAHGRELEAQVAARTRDLSEAKDRIEAQADQLRELDRLKTRFFSNISHEFRTPLTLNIGPLENALTGVYGPLSGPLQKQLSIMLRNARRLLRLINQLLDLSKLESGKMAIRRRRGDLAGFVEGVVLSFTAFAERKRLDLQFDSTLPADATAAVAFDPECMEKVFFNLLSNAVKFTPEGGRITVTLEPAPEGVRARVTDTGQGIPAKDLPYIFDRFHQVDGAVSDVQEGTGIGLSLVKELVELHGGVIEVESEPGTGTSFLVTLPLGDVDATPDGLSDGSTAEAREIPAHPAPHRGDGVAADAPPALARASEAAGVSHGPMVEMAVFDDEDAPSATGASTPEAGAEADGAGRPTLLVVDDNQDIRDYMVSCLEGRYRLRTARDGQEALEAVHEDAPDLIISDVMMPRLSGYAFCRALKDDPALRHIPVVLLTAKASVDEKVEGLEAGADDYLTKPFNARELLARVENLLVLRRHQQELRALNDELGVANEALRAASELKSQFLRIAAHDLRTPLHSIQGFADLAKEETSGEDAHELLDLILTNSRRMADLITQILEAEALESGEMTFDLQPMDAGRFVLDVAEHHRAAAAQKEQSLHAEVPGEAPLPIEASDTWLREAVDNLVSNAIKYSPPGRPIRLDARRAEGGVQLRVRDEGPGILPEDRPRLFKKFQKLSARPTGGESSTGLGLSIVKQIVEAHGGRVWVDSEPGEGSTFVIELPAADAQAADAGSTSPPSPAAPPLRTSS